MADLLDGLFFLACNQHFQLHPRAIVSPGAVRERSGLAVEQLLKLANE